MSKRRRRHKKLFPPKMAADYINVSQRVDVARMSAYRERVKTTTGAKNNVSPLHVNTFSKPIRDGQVCVIYCVCGKGPFTFQQDYEKHVKDMRMVEHEPEYIPDTRAQHMDIETGKPVSHVHIVTEDIVLDDEGNPKIERNRLPKVQVNKRRFEVLQANKFTKINELSFFKIGDYRLHFTPTGDKWYFTTFIGGEELQSGEYISKDRALIDYYRKRIFWRKS